MQVCINSSLLLSLATSLNAAPLGQDRIEQSPPVNPLVQSQIPRELQIPLLEHLCEHCPKHLSGPNDSRNDAEIRRALISKKIAMYWQAPHKNTVLFPNSAHNLDFSFTFLIFNHFIPTINCHDLSSRSRRTSTKDQ